MLTKHYVYILQSVSHPDQFYTGLCSDVAARLTAHNAGQSPHTSKYKPFERYLKSGSGRAFSAKRLR
jgi:predicted GIY-YIG superfamily endonuclease